jgi:predicted RNA methylase
MARLMSQIKGGWYPAAPEAVDAVLQRLRPPQQGECLVVDPCAGTGFALLQLAEKLGAVPYGIELSEDRAEIMRDLLPDDQTLAPADFFRTSISYGSFSFALVNPPFANAVGEGRVEVAFLQRATNLLVDDGLMIFIAPESVARSSSVCDRFTERYYNISAMRFPDNVRHYDEVVLMGMRRKQAQPAAWTAYDWLDRQLEKNIVYTLPSGTRPRTFCKTEPTDAELVRLVAQSPLRFLIDRPAVADTEANRPRPPMSIGIGHRALLLASGHVNGLVCPPDEPPHVIRGTAAKDQYVASCDTTEDDDGNLTTRTVISEKPRLVIRVLDFQGNIKTLE